MFKSNLKKIKEINKGIDNSSHEHHHRKSLAEKRYERVSSKIKNNRSSELKKRVRKKLSSY